MAKLVQTFKNFVKEEEGATMIEYALLAALISVVAIVTITAVGLSVDATFESLRDELDQAVSGG